ncbi:MAG: FtsX-like permease family protein [Burkholderiaceae bacterium]|nr:FtsX-like permease family protein [Burkholderiaceae bacterium]
MRDPLLSLRLAWRDWRAGELRLLIAALVVAVGAIASVGFFVDRMRAALEQEAAQLLGADLVIGSDRPPDETLAAEAARRGLQVARTVVFPSMARAGGLPQLASVKAVSDNYPLRGRVRVAELPPAAGGPSAVGGEVPPAGRHDPPAASPAAHDAAAAHAPARGEAWLDPQLVQALGIARGGTVEFGDSQFRVTRQITLEPDRGTGFVNFAPRAMFALDDLAATGLVQPASRVRWQLMFAGEPAAVTGFAQWAQSRLGRGQRIESLESGRPELRATLDRAEQFLSLVALLSALIAAVAIGLAARRFAERHLDGCAVMKAMGLTQPRLLRLLGLELLWISLAGAAVGIALGWAVHFGLVAAVAPLIEIPLPEAGWLPALQALIVALVLMGGFGAWPFLRLAGVPPLRVLRREVGGAPASAWVATALATAAFCALLFWFAGSVRLAVVAIGGFAVGALVFVVVAFAMVRLIEPLRRAGFVAGSPALRLAFASWSRRRAMTVAQTVALSIGLMALLLLTVTRTDLIEGWRRASPPDAPNRFLVNIQPDQGASVRAALEGVGVRAPEVFPMVRGRLVTVNGKPVLPEDYDDDRAQRMIDREFNLSYAEHLPEHNRIVAGRWFAPDALEVSAEQGIMKTLGLALGDKLGFDVAGEIVTVRLSSVRGVAWDSMKVNFFMILSPAALSGQPQTLITAYHQPESSPGLDRALLQRFPNLTVFDTGNLVRQVQTMLDQVIRAVQVLFVLTLAAGVAVLWGALASSRDERVREAGLMRALGASGRQLASAQLIELAFSGALAGVLAAAGSIAIGWVLADQVFRFAYEPRWWVLPAGAAIGAALALLAGWLGLRNVLRVPPLATLRNA